MLKQSGINWINYWFEQTGVAWQAITCVCDHWRSELAIQKTVPSMVCGRRSKRWLIQRHYKFDSYLLAPMGSHSLVAHWLCFMTTFNLRPLSLYTLTMVHISSTYCFTYWQEDNRYTWLSIHNRGVSCVMQIIWEILQNSNWWPVRQFHLPHKWWSSWHYWCHSQMFI